MNGAAINKKMDINGIADIDVNHVNDGMFINKHSEVKINESDRIIADINKEVVSNKNGVYTIITTVEEIPPEKCESKPYQGSSSDNQFGKIDSVGPKKGFDPYINSVYVVDDDYDDNNVVLPRKQSEDLSAEKDTKVETGDTIKNLNVTNQNGKERNSVIIDGEEVFLRKSPKDQRSPSGRQTWKSNQNVVSEAFGFLKEITDIDDRLSTERNDALIKDKLDSETSEQQEQISRSGRQPTWRTNQRVVSQAFDFLKEVPDIDDRLSSISFGDAQEFFEVSDSKNKLENSDIEKSDNQNVFGISQVNENESAQQSLPDSELQSKGSQLLPGDNPSNQSREHQSTNQNMTSVLTNQKRASETSSIASEDLGELGGFKNSKFRSNNNKDDDGDSSDEDVGMYFGRPLCYLYLGNIFLSTANSES